MMFDTGSIEYCNCQQRVDGLYRKSNGWLLNEAKKVTGNRLDAAELVSDLYLYLLEKCNPKIFWGDTFNLFYCNKFLYSRWMNKVKTKNRTILSEIDEEIPENEYDTERDLEMQRLHEEVQNELKSLQSTKLWASEKIFSLYFEGDDTMDELAKKIGISKSTTFLAIKRIRTYLKSVINNAS